MKSRNALMFPGPERTFLFLFPKTKIFYAQTTRREGIESKMCNTRIQPVSTSCRSHLSLFNEFRSNHDVMIVNYFQLIENIIKNEAHFLAFFFFTQPTIVLWVFPFFFFNFPCLGEKKLFFSKVVFFFRALPSLLRAQAPSALALWNVDTTASIIWRQIFF